MPNDTMMEFRIRTKADLADFADRSLEVHEQSFHRIYSTPDGRTLDRQDFLTDLLGVVRCGDGPVLDLQYRAGMPLEMLGEMLGEER